MPPDGSIADDEEPCGGNSLKSITKQYSYVQHLGFHISRKKKLMRKEQRTHLSWLKSCLDFSNRWQNSAMTLFSCKVISTWLLFSGWPFVVAAAAMSMWVMSTCICGTGADDSPLFKTGSGTAPPPNEHDDEDSEDPVDDLPETILLHCVLLNRRIGSDWCFRRVGCKWKLFFSPVLHTLSHFTSLFLSLSLSFALCFFLLLQYYILRLCTHQYAVPFFLHNSTKNHIIVDVWWNNGYFGSIVCVDLQYSKWNLSRKIVIW